MHSQIILPRSADGAGRMHSPAICTLAEGGHVVAACESVGRTSRIQAQLLDRELQPLGKEIAIPVSHGLASLSLAPLDEGGFALAWNEGELVRIGFYDDAAQCVRTLDLARVDCHSPNFQILSRDGALALNWQRALIIIPIEGPPLLCAYRAKSSYSTAIILGDGRFLRIDTRIETPGHNPIYGFEGSYFDIHGREIDRFETKLPVSIISNCYAHPDQLRVVASDSGPILMWTLLAHSRHNMLQARRCDLNGIPTGETAMLARAPEDGHLGAPAAVLVDRDRFLITWVRSAEIDYILEGCYFSTALESLGDSFVIASGLVEEHNSVHRLSDGRTIALWCEEDGAHVQPISF